jgi:hypothetical protein
MPTVADHVIEKCGGPKVVSEWLGLDLSNVYRFTYSRSNGGTDGIIPAKHQAALLTKARENGIDLRPDDFFVTDDPPTSPSEGEVNSQTGHAA